MTEQAIKKWIEGHAIAAFRHKVGEPVIKVSSVKELIKGFQNEIKEWEDSFNVYHKALMWGTEMFRKAHRDFPKQSHPDTGRMIAWLCERIEHLELAEETYLQQLLDIKNRENKNNNL